MDEDYAQTLVNYQILKKSPDETDAAYNARVLDAASGAKYLGEVQDKIFADRDSAVADLNKKFNLDSRKTKLTDDELRALKQSRDAAVIDTYRNANEQWNAAHSEGGRALRGVFPI